MTVNQIKFQLENLTKRELAGRNKTKQNGHLTKLGHRIVLHISPRGGARMRPSCPSNSSVRATIIAHHN